MPKRKHGVGSVPMAFSTQYYEQLRSIKVNGGNLSEYIDDAIRHYDETLNWKAKGISEFEHQESIFRKNVSAVKRYVMARAADTAWEDQAWLMQLRRWIALEYQGEEE